MRKGLFREPIHLHVSNRGKLRKIEHRRVEQKEAEGDLVLTPHLVVPEGKPERKHHYHINFRKLEDKSRNMFISEVATETEQDSGTFRAIHTALPYHSLRGSPLRTVTPLKSFRSGLHSSSKMQKKTVEIGLIQEETTPSKGRFTISPKSTKRSQILSFHSPELHSKIQQNEEQYEQFYKYKERKQPWLGKLEEEHQRIAGTKIEPFKKYQIRGIRKHTSAQRTHNLLPQPS